MADEFSFARRDRVTALKEQGESAMKASLAKGMPHGYEVGYESFTINGRMLGHGEPVRVKAGGASSVPCVERQRHGNSQPGAAGPHVSVVALDGNPVPNARVDVPVLWLGTAERISAIVEMNHPGVWIMGDLADDDRHHGMGIVVEYAGQEGKPHVVAPPPFHWNYARFAQAGAERSAQPDETFEMIVHQRQRRRAKDSIAGRSMAWPIR